MGAALLNEKPNSPLITAVTGRDGPYLAELLLGKRRAARSDTQRIDPLRVTGEGP
uniref:Uncharacterized protein n=1 Tax=Candidatus Kentrum eta TaxID=2126337 RepID=A0A450UTJ2_9GAMM|nr:MAG: hypothetical protein BECKH772A_GA0070896_100937 [Candidatus Kentron sp. H]VFJ97711.1 MAG: hypothetical protein BECKH772B_GA0070898_101177 [Candidatus Kentron sp. H]VFK02949.1 MAG: hypothetical protein BECKH772C_GA0070978_101097 [Candidatus Kentron sp. H]